MSLTVCCVWVRGPVAYTADYVVRLERMVRRNLSRPFRFVCLTDQPKALPSHIETIRIDGLSVPMNGAGYWCKVRLFDPRLELSGRVLFLDLDTLVVAPLDSIVDFPAAFALTDDSRPEGHVERDRFSRKVVRKFNSSVMVWDAGLASQVFTAWSPAVAQRLSTDQDWIAEVVPEAQPMPKAWFPRISKVQPPWPSEAKVVLVKKPKNHIACERWPWFEPLWGAA